MLFSRQIALIRLECSRRVAVKVSFPRRYRINSITADNNVRWLEKSLTFPCVPTTFFIYDANNIFTLPYIMLSSVKIEQQTNENRPVRSGPACRRLSRARFFSRLFPVTRPYLIKPTRSLTRKIEINDDRETPVRSNERRSTKRAPRHFLHVSKIRLEHVLWLTPKKFVVLKLKSDLRVSFSVIYDNFFYVLRNNTLRYVTLHYTYFKLVSAYFMHKNILRFFYVTSHFVTVTFRHVYDTISYVTLNYNALHYVYVMVC